MYFIVKSTLRFVVLLALALGCYSRFLEPNWLDTTAHSIPFPRLTRPLRVVHLSDLHASPEVSPKLVEESLRIAVAAKPDVITVTGDFVTATTGFDRPWLVAQLSLLARAAPTFAVLGNHDGGEWSAIYGDSSSTEAIRSVLRESGITLLDNEARMIEVHRQAVQLVGVGDLWSGEMDPSRAFGQAQSGLPTILLSHNPDSKVQLKPYEWDLMLSGHTHGGQVVIPFLGWSPAPVWDRRFIRGLHPWQGRWIHISRGVGNARGIRFNCRPEVTILTLAPKTL